MFRRTQQIGPYKLIDFIRLNYLGEVWLAEGPSERGPQQLMLSLPEKDRVDFEIMPRIFELLKKVNGHPNLLQIIDTEIYDGQPVIAARNFNSLADQLRHANRLGNRNRFPLEKSFKIIIDILKGLEILHQNRIVHSCLNPRNILMIGDSPQLTDFGQSMFEDLKGYRSTDEYAMSYMAPELLAPGGLPSVQTDIRSAGKILRELMSIPVTSSDIRRIFSELGAEGARLDELLKESGHESQTDFAEMPEEVSLQLRQILEKIQAGKPEDRYQSAAELGGDLEKSLERLKFLSDPKNAPFVPTDILNSPNFPDIRQADSILLKNDWSGLSPESPIKRHCRLERAGPVFKGDAGFSSGGERGPLKKSQWKVEVAAETVQSFLEKLSFLPLQEGHYKPIIEMTDHYPSNSVELHVKDEKIIIFTRSQISDHWGVSFNGKTYVSRSNIPVETLSELTKLLGKEESPSLLNKFRQVFRK